MHLPPHIREDDVATRPDLTRSYPVARPDRCRMARAYADQREMPATTDCLVVNQGAQGNVSSQNRSGADGTLVVVRLQGEGKGNTATTVVDAGRRAETGR